MTTEIDSQAMLIALEAAVVRAVLRNSDVEGGELNETLLVETIAGMERTYRELEDENLRDTDEV